MRHLALLHNAVNEPHFHWTSATASERAARPGVLVAECEAGISGYATWSYQDFDRADRAWIGWAIHPDHLQDDTASALLEAVIDDAGPACASLWLTVREDYLSASPDPRDHGFAEVHRTFGGGCFLDERNVVVRAAPTDITMHALDDVDGAAVASFYEQVRADKVLAEPTITAASTSLDMASALTAGSCVAVQDDIVVGLCLSYPSDLGAWLGVLAVSPAHRRNGIALALLTRAMAGLHHAGVTFLNTAGVGSDLAFLRTVRAAGATIEPDWIAYERRISTPR